MTNATTAPVQSLVDELLADLENQADEYDSIRAGEGDLLRNAAELIRGQQALIAQQAAPVAVPGWTEAQVRDFLSVAMRHVEINGTLLYIDINDGLRYMAEKGHPAFVQPAPTQPAQQSQLASVHDNLLDGAVNGVTEGERLESLARWLEQQHFRPDVMSIAAADLRALHRRAKDAERAAQYFAPPEQAEQPNDDPTPPEALASRLISIWVETHGKPIPWAHAVRITAIATNLPQQEIDRLLAMDDAAPEQTEQGALSLRAEVERLQHDLATAHADASYYASTTEEQRAEVERLKSLLKEAGEELKEMKESVGYRAHTLDVIQRIDAALENNR